jgi:hypothetical protein
MRTAKSLVLDDQNLNLKELEIVAFTKKTGFPSPDKISATKDHFQQKSSERQSMYSFLPLNLIHHQSQMSHCLMTLIRASQGFEIGILGYECAASVDCFPPMICCHFLMSCPPQTVTSTNQDVGRFPTHCFSSHQGSVGMANQGGFNSCHTAL